MKDKKSVVKNCRNARSEINCVKVIGVFEEFSSSERMSVVLCIIAVRPVLLVPKRA